MSRKRTSLIATITAASCALVLLAPQFAGAAPAAPGKPASPSSPSTSSTPVPLISGTTYSSASCSGLEIVGSQILCEAMTMPMDTPTPVAVATASPAPTVLPTAAVPTATALPLPTSTVGVIVKNAANFGNWSPSARDTCTKAEHDSFAVIGPDGLRYPTWHPPVMTRPNGQTCTFGHEHGDDPSLSKVTSAPPPFGYAAIQMNDLEPHEGYKVVVLNPGDTGNLESNLHGSSAVSTIAVRAVVHTGTSGVGRYGTIDHSLQYDYRDPAVGEFHIYGMAFTGAASGIGSTCDTPRKGLKDLSLTTCADTYEIWNSYGFEIDSAAVRAGSCCAGPMQSPLNAGVTPAVFDPITTADPADLTKLLYTAVVKPPNVGGTIQSPSIDPTSPESWAQGCKREFYTGMVYLANAWSPDMPTDYWTDPHGVIGPVGGDAAHMIHQYVSRNYGNTQELFKQHSEHCGNGIHSPN